MLSYFLFVLSRDIFSHYSETGHCDASIEHRHKIICVLMRSSFKLLGFSSIKSFVMIDSFSFEGFDFVFQLDSLFFLLFFLLMGPIKNSFGLFLVKSKLLLLEVIIFVDLSVFHLKLRNVISGFVFVCF